MQVGQPGRGMGHDDEKVDDLPKCQSPGGGGGEVRAGGGHGRQSSCLQSMFICLPSTNAACLLQLLSLA